MKAALGNAFIVNFIIIFTIIFIGLFVGATSYTKALRIKNRITDIIEEHGEYNNTTVDEEINNYLADAGYRISNSDSSNCKINGMDSSSYSIEYPSAGSSVSQYDYCIFKFNTNKGSYYGVKTYMYLDLPIIGDKVKIGVYGETKILDIFGI